MIILELNEINLDNKSLSKLNYLSQKINEFKCNIVETIPDSLTEYEGLDPWVQWPTIHNCCSVKEHSQLRHGDSVNKSKKNDIFFKLNKKNKNTIAWGIMNPSSKIRCNVLLPDPWSYEIEPQPHELKKFADLPNYFAQNYQKQKFFKLTKSLFSTLYYTYKKLNYKELFITAKNILKLLIKYKKIDSLLIFCWFELISIKVFKKFYNKKTIAFIFINSIAHYQHGFWNCKKATATINVFLEILMNELSFWDNYSKNNGHIITALSQENSNTRYVYNFKNPKLFIKKVLRLSYKIYEMGMTNEITLFPNKADSTKILKKLKNIKINDKPLLRVQLIKKDKSSENDKIFFQFKNEELVDKNTTFSSDKEEFHFNDFFYVYKKRTGVHKRKGYLISKNIKNIKLKNESIMNKIFNLV